MASYRTVRPAQLQRDLFEGLPVDRLTVVDLAPGDALWERGDASDGIYVVDTGCVELVADVPVGRRGPGQALGLVGLLRDEPRGARAWARTHTSLRWLDGAATRALASSSPGFALQLAQRVAREEPWAPLPVPTLGLVTAGAVDALPVALAVRAAATGRRVLVLDAAAPSTPARLTAVDGICLLIGEGAGAVELPAGHRPAVVVVLGDAAPPSTLWPVVRLPAGAPPGDLIEHLLHIVDVPRAFHAAAPFAGADPVQLRELWSAARIDAAREGKVLSEARDPADDMLLVLRGRLAADGAGPGGGAAHFGAGEVAAWFGTHEETRPFAIRAERGTDIARFDRATWRALEARLGELGADRREGVGRRKRGTIAVVAMTESVPIARLVRALANGLELPDPEGALVGHRRAAAELGQHRDELTDATVAPWLRRVELSQDLTIFVCPFGKEDWNRQCLAQSDHVLWVSDASENPQELPPRPFATGEHHLVLLHDGPIEGTAAWLDAFPGLPWYHVRSDSLRADLGRAGRRVLGVATGVSLSGAGSRGVAHVGVLLGLREHGVFPDVTTGTSSGSYMAAIGAMQADAEESIRFAVRSIVDYRPGASHLAPPLVAMMSGRHVARSLQGIFGDRRIEDLPVSCRITAADLVERKRVVLDRGPLWEAVRASTSLPVIYPPVIRGDGKALVDGGLFDTVPLSPLARDCANGRIIASHMADLSQGSWEGGTVYGSWLSGWRALLDKINPFAKTRYPSLPDVLVESITLESNRRLGRIEGHEDGERLTILRPPIPPMGFFDVDRESVVRELIEKTRTYTVSEYVAERPATDAFSRGVPDSLEHTMPLAWTGSHEPAR